MRSTLRRRRDYPERSRLTPRAALPILVAGLLAVLAVSPVAVPAASAASAPTYSNPVYLNTGIPDPQVTLGGDGYYYLTGTTTGSSIEIIRSASLTDMSGAVRKTVFTPAAPFNKDVWAPELHRLDGKWYIYTTASNLDYATAGGAAVANNRILVLENTSANPLDGTWTSKGPVSGVSTSIGSLDGTVFESGGIRYFMFVYSSNGNHIFIATLSNPWTLSSTPVEIVKPTLGWEGQWTTEGPAALVRNGRVFVSYSANDCASDDYSLGEVTASQSSDLLNPASWTKQSQPVMTSNPAAGVFGPGHNSFTTSPDGTEDYIVYHANSAAGQGCGGNRMARVQRMGWNADGSPMFPTPASTNIPTPSWDVGASALVRNGSFEADQHAASAPSQWTSTDTNPEAFYSESGGRTGSFKGTQWSDHSYRVYTYQRITNLPAGAYTLTAWVKSSGGQAETSVELKNFASGSSKKLVSIPQASTWTRVQIPGVNVTAGEATVGFWSNASAGQWLSFDDVQLTPDTYANYTFEGDGPGAVPAGWTATVPGWATAQTSPTTRELATPSTGSGVALAGDTRWTDYAAETDVKFSAINSGGLGLLTRVSDANHFYQVELSRLGSGALGWDFYKNDGGAWTKLAEGTRNFDLGTTYRLRSTGIGSQLKAELSSDGGKTWEPLGQATDSSLSAGQVGVRAQGGATGTFDNVTVTRADANSAPKLDLQVSPRCVAGKAVLAVKATNNDSMALNVGVTTTYGSPAKATINVTKSVASTTNTRLAQIAAGSVNASVSAVRDGVEVATSVQSAYSAISCG
ncbi:glycoside hydrolase family 43 protein [Agreia pratensis]|uniref:glycoside hydrolase family 43 protein n=1 Tax=Agreia pratensis TaxID=150121 RepID=UPI00188D1348|nr:glycoside hydrolase family 43 protein [Agreia pratensis]MBF4635800.1 glycoside hydrolase family 43 protein [Agreia pratensis]